jgi:hypothetical protein
MEFLEQVLIEGTKRENFGVTIVDDISVGMDYL